MTEADLLASATRFSFGRFADPLAAIGDWIDVEAIPGPAGVRWAILCGKWAHTHSGVWVLDPVHGGWNGDDYLSRARWADRDDAVAVARWLIGAGHPDTPAWKRRRVT